MGNVLDCCKEKEDAHDSLTVPLVSAQRKVSRQSQRSITSTGLDSTAEDHLTPIVQEPNVSPRILQASVGSESPISFVVEDDEYNSESESESGFVLPPVLPPNSSGLRRALFEHQNSTGLETKAEDSPPPTVTFLGPRSGGGSGLKRVERRASLLADELESSRFAPFPLPVVSINANHFSRKLTFALLLRSIPQNAEIVTEIMNAGSPDSIVRQGLALAFAQEVVGKTFDVILLDATNGEDEIIPSSNLARVLREKGFNGCIMLFLTSAKNDKVDFSVIDGTIDISSAPGTVLPDISVARAIALKRNQSSISSVPPSQANSWNSNFVFGPIEPTATNVEGKSAEG